MLLPIIVLFGRSLIWLVISNFADLKPKLILQLLVEDCTNGAGHNDVSDTFAYNLVQYKSNGFLIIGRFEVSDGEN